MPQWPWKKQRPGVDEYGRSEVWHLAANGDVVGSRKAIQAGADPTAADKDGFSALHVAAQNGHLEVIAALLAAGANPNALDRHGNGALWVACYEGTKAVSGPNRHAIITALLKAGANPDAPNKAGSAPQIWREHSDDVNAAFNAAGR
jgi:ankyrin repeat protein